MSARWGLLATALLLVLASCQPPPERAAPGTGAPGDPPGPRVDDDVGSFSVSLTVGGAYRFDRFSYDVSGNGFHKADTVNVAASNTVSAIIGPIPFGAGYVVQLTMQDVDHKLTPCTGSASFDITSTGPVPVPVHLTCREVPKPQPIAAPIPRWASIAFAAVLLGLGALATRRRDRAA
jgi:hypothetical protein